MYIYRFDRGFWASLQLAYLHIEELKDAISLTEFPFAVVAIKKTGVVYWNYKGSIVLGFEKSFSCVMDKKIVTEKEEGCRQGRFQNISIGT